MTDEKKPRDEAATPELDVWETKDDFLVSKSAYEKLQSEVERLKWAARNNSAYPSAMCYAEALEAKLQAAEADIAYWKGAWKAYSEQYSVEKSGRLQAIDDARRLAEALEKVKPALQIALDDTGDFYYANVSGDIDAALAEYRREFGPQSNVLTKNKLD